jgi:hypothetical protein
MHRRGSMYAKRVATGALPGWIGGCYRTHRSRKPYLGTCVGRWHEQPAGLPKITGGPISPSHDKMTDLDDIFGSLARFGG